MTTEPARYIQEFFAGYPTFDYDLSAPFFDEFQRLKKVSHFNKPQWERARDGLRAAMVKQFNAMYGTNADDLESWQLLCSALGMDPVPNDIQTCRRKLQSTHVNLVDFVEAPMSGKPVRTFRSQQGLSTYTKTTEKFFPRRDVNAGSLLGCLLRQILNPPPTRGKARRARIGATN
ncbi:hypothetical protein C8Q70DRAFT_490319 [Cubamyces menziesii]|nr:hypothetical protein C8Q70DRAFT_490319 [Cubamyces menziesii]